MTDTATWLCLVYMQLGSDHACSAVHGDQGMKTLYTDVRMSVMPQCAVVAEYSLSCLLFLVCFLA